MAIGVEHRGAKAGDAGQQDIDRTPQALLVGFLDHGLHLRGCAGQVAAAKFAGHGQFVVDHGLGFVGGDAVAHESRKTAPGGRGQQGHHIAQAQIDGHRQRRFLPMHQGGAAVAPYSQGHGVAGFFHQGGQAFAGHFDSVQTRQRGQAQAQCGGAQFVAGAAVVLHHQPQALEADQITVGLGRAHAGRRGQVPQHQRAGSLGEHIEQGEPDFHRLDAGAFLAFFGQGRLDGEGGCHVV